MEGVFQFLSVAALVGVGTGRSWLWGGLRGGGGLLFVVLLALVEGSDRDCRVVGEPVGGLLRVVGGEEEAEVVIVVVVCVERVFEDGVFF